MDELKTLHRLQKAEIRPAAAMFARAFQNDALYAYLMPKTEGRERLLPLFFEFRLRFGLLYGEVYAASPLLEGAAIWLSSTHSAMTPLRMLRAGGLSLMRNAGSEIINRLRSLEDFAGQMRQRSAPAVYWHLSPIAVDPTCQGKGIASRLLRPFLARMEAEHTPCFLETQSEKNVAIYQHYGFRMVETGVIPGTAIPHFAMLRNENL